MRSYFLVVLLVTLKGLHATTSCPSSGQYLPGPPGRDGRDGIPGQPGKDGKDGRDGTGPGSTLSYREFFELREAIFRSLNFEEHLRNVKDVIKSELYNQLKQEIVHELRDGLCSGPPTSPPPPTPPPINPNVSVHSSCDEIYRMNPSSPSGNYYIRFNNSVVEVYCEMGVRHGNSSGGWMRVAYINTSNPSPYAACPPSTAQYSVGDKTLCGPVQGVSCSSVVIPTYDVPYSNVWGRARGHAFGFPCAFSYNTRPLRDGYFSGLSITQGPLHDSSSHVWTYAIGFSEVQDTRCNCPCTRVRGNPPPDYVGDDFYCDTPTFGAGQNWDTQNVLWDGNDCYRGDNIDCCANTHQPWFLKALSNTTTNDIAVRWCSPHSLDYSNFGTDLLELYVR